LHGEILAAAKMSLEKAIQIGELLSRVRASRKGKWLLWLKDNVPFSQPTAWRYIECYQRRSELFNVNNLADGVLAEQDEAPIVAPTPGPKLEPQTNKAPKVPLLEESDLTEEELGVIKHLRSHMSSTPDRRAKIFMRFICEGVGSGT